MTKPQTPPDAPHKTLASCPGNSKAGIIPDASPNVDAEMGLVESYYSLTLDSGNTAAGDNAECDLFMRGFAYGRFTELNSELALHWGWSRNFPADLCPLVSEPHSLLRTKAALRADLVLLGKNAIAREAEDAKLIAELRNALEPFAKAADVKLCGEWRDDQHFGQTDVSFYLTFGDLRHARAALASLPDERV